jgi:hypothetical protein
LHLKCGIPIFGSTEHQLDCDGDGDGVDLFNASELIHPCLLAAIQEDCEFIMSGATETVTTTKATQAAKFNIGIPSEHKPRSTPNEEEITGTVEYPPALFPNYLPVWEVPQAK